MKWYSSPESRQMDINSEAVGDLGIDEGFIASGKITANGLRQAGSWLGTYCAEFLDQEEKQEMFDAYVWLMEEADRRDSRKATNEAKRQFAQENGIPFSQVRVSKKVSA
jgi:hypothetical protein